LADGLMKSWQMIKAERAKNPNLNPLLVVISDGEANVPIQQGRKVMDELLALAAHIRQDGIASVAIDTKPRSQSSDEMRQIAASLGARYHHISRLLAKDVLELVRTTAAAER
jgi:magnesium chelatase subunit D